MLICARWGLAAVFITAAVGKLLDREGSRASLADFGLPPAFAGPVAWGLPLAELTIAAGLIARPTAQLAAAAALILLAAFVAGLANALRGGREPDCHCFGAIHSAPASRATIARNLALMVPATLVLAAGPGDALADGGATAAALVAVSAVAFGLALATYTLLRRGPGALGAATPSRQRYLAVGTPAPAARVRDEQERWSDITEYLTADRPTALVFVAPGCGPCDHLIPHLARWRTVLDERVKVVMVSGMPHPDGPPAVAAERYPGVLWDVEEEVADAYQLNASPAALLLDPDGTIASSPAFGLEAIEALLRVAQGRTYAPARPLAAA